MGEYELKGSAPPLKLYQVVKDKGPTSRIEAASAAGLTPLVGRSKESAAVEDAWASALAGHAPILILVGEPGIGKSRLIYDLSTHVGQRVPVIELRASEHARSSAFHMVLECLQRRADILHGEPAESIRSKVAVQFDPLGLNAEHVAAVASLLGVPLAPSLELTAGRQRGAMLEALSTWVVGTTATDPKLLVIEDLHWADPSTLELLTMVFERTVSRRFLVVLSARPEFVSPWTLNRIDTVWLRRLDSHDACTVIARIAGGQPLPSEMVDRLVARAEGIPLFLEEMTKATLESGFLRATTSGYVLEDPQAHWTIPATLHDSLMGRLDQLGQSKPLVQLAAVLGREFTYGLFEAVWRRLPSAPNIHLANGLARLVHAQLLIHVGEPTDGTYQFRHSLVQEAAYQSLVRNAQREYHQHTAYAFVQDFPARAEAEPEVIARHYSAAHLIDKALEYWTKAGERAIGASAYAEAISHFGAALEQLANLPSEPSRVRRELDLRARLGVALITTRGFTAKEVEESYTRSSELCAELGDEVPYRVLYGVWAVNLIRGDLASSDRMVPHLERLVEQRTDAESVVIGNTMLASWSFFRGDYHAALKSSSSAIRHYDLDRPKEQHSDLLLKHGFEGLLWPGCWLALCHTVMGDAANADHAWRHAADLAERIGDPYAVAGVLAFGALMKHELGDLTAAAELSGTARKLSEERGFLHWLAIATIISGSCKVAEGAEHDSVATVDEGLTLLKKIGDRSIYIHYMSYLAHAYVQCGRLNEALDILQEALALTRVHIARFCEPELLRLVGEARAAQGDLDAARDCLVSALNLSTTQGAYLYELRVAMSLARVLRSAGDSTGAANVLGGARERFGKGVDFPLLRRVDHFLGSRSERNT